MVFMFEAMLLVLPGMFLSSASPLHGNLDDENAIIRIENPVTSTNLEETLYKKPQDRGDVFYVQPTWGKTVMENIYSRIQKKTRLYQILTSRNISCAFVYLRTEGGNSSKEMLKPEEHFQDVRIQVVNEFLDNQEVDAANNSTDLQRYDHKGAMYFAVAVITIYGLSIALLIASSVRRSGEDYELKGFIRSFAKLRVDRVVRPREKFKVGRALLDSGALLRLTAQGHILPKKLLPVLLLADEADTSSSSKLSAVTSSSAGNSGVNSGQGSSECSLDSTKEEAVPREIIIDNGCDGEMEGDEEKEDHIAFQESKDAMLSKEEGTDNTAAMVTAGPRHVKIYQGKERGKIDVRSMDVALDIPENSTI